MRTDTVSRRYARALFGLAEGQGAVDAVGVALAATAELLEDPRVARVLTGPVARERRQEILREIAERTGAPPTFRDFLLLLAERDRLAHLSGVRVFFEALADSRRGRTRAAVRSAIPLSQDVVAELAQVFGEITGKQVIANVTVDRDLIAGVIVEVEGRVYDGSLRTQLEKLHRQMATGG